MKTEENDHGTQRHGGHQQELHLEERWGQKSDQGVVGKTEMRPTCLINLVLKFRSKNRGSGGR